MCRTVLHTEHLQIVALKANSLVHVLEQTTRSRDEDVHA